KVEYEVLTPVLSPTEAMAEGAPKVHEGGNLLADEHLKRGDADARIKASKYVVTTKYSTPFTDHAFLEPETAVAMPDNDGILVYCGDQGIYQTRRECAEALGLPEEKVRVIAKMVGGGFGGKEDMSVQHYAALLAFKSQKPVKFALTRKESILVHPKRHPMEMEFTTACDENGKLTAMKATIISDTGAYASLGGPVLQRACTHAAGPYNYQDIDIEGRAYYTNNPPAGAFRGFGVTQSCFATECNLNLLAEKVGISPWEMRYRNAIRPGETLPNGQIADDSTALAETLEAVKSYMDEHPKAGIACAIKNSGLGVGIPDVGRCRLVVEDGKVHIYSSAACIGQGLGTVMTQMVCTTLKLPPEKVVYCEPDTSKAPNSGNTTASRQTVFTGEATRRASLALRDALGTASLESLNGQEFKGEYSSETDKMGSDKPHPV
ncbi:MAG: molybdopterin cofactor-binding domain-containing protein, partial [Hydrogenoanaerobacterium sp.]